MSLWLTHVKAKRHKGPVGRKLKLLGLILWHPEGISLLMGYMEIPIEREKNGASFVFQVR